MSDLVFDLHITAVQADCSTNTLTDDTVYGGANPLRSVVYNYLIGTKMDVESVPTYIAIDNTIPATVTEWAFPTTNDGWYQFFLLSASAWASGAYTAATTVNEVVQNDASVVFYVTDGYFYKCIVDTVSNEVPTDTDFWIQLDPLLPESNFVPLIDNTTIDTHQHDNLVTCYGEECLAGELEKAVAAGLCKDCKEYADIKSYQRLDVLINGAYAKNYVDKMIDAEEIMRFVEDFCASCK